MSTVSRLFNIRNTFLDPTDVVSTGTNLPPLYNASKLVNVDLSINNLTNGQAIIYDGVINKWINSSSISGYIGGTGPTGYTGYTGRNS